MIKEYSRTKRKRVWIVLFVVLILCCLVVTESPGNFFSLEVSAKASDGVKRKAIKAYRRFISQSDYTWFYAVDIDKDNLKELIVSHEQYPGNISIYKYRNKRVRKIWDDHAVFWFSYNRKTKRLHGAWGGCGSRQDWYLKISKSGKIKKVYLDMIEEGVNNGKPIYGYYYADKKISRKTYNKKFREWEKNCTQIKMIKKSKKNIKKYIR